MVKVKSRTQIESNYRGAAGTAATRYKEAIPTVEWNAPAAAGQNLWVQRMADPEVQARRLKGIAEVTDAEFRQAMTDKGANVIQGRMSSAAPKMATNFEPYRLALQSVTLPARSADPMTNIDQRLKPIVQAMVDTKKAQG